MKEDFKYDNTHRSLKLPNIKFVLDRIENQDQFMTASLDENEVNGKFNQEAIKDENALE